MYKVQANLAMVAFERLESIIDHIVRLQFTSHRPFRETGL